jgi:hypothetical protein
MKNRLLVTLSCAVLLSFHGILSLANPATANSPLKFKPPSRNRPKITIGGASRSACIQDPKGLQPLLPQSKFGLTTTDQPQLMLYLPKNKGKALLVNLMEVGSDRPLIAKPLSFPISGNPGVVQLNLGSASLPKLEIGKQYVWKASLQCETTIEISGEEFVEVSTPVFIEGVIEPIKPDKMLRNKLKNADPKSLPRIYAEAGIWYDAIGSLYKLRHSQSANTNWQNDWESLLKSAELSEFTQAPVMECCKEQI